ncbi:hypothetical protein ACFFQW_34370 [Umezawaea endophytica]|uniref:Uncharacterized protein n=1 Tax=Umezawaea endophytica TaxID=1654476 RepID=A0A9X2VK44_9PSEU|nr:hypothetical protein [Umezawaea endophytica]MCS7477547.1 hypothetical protein [Umezawaea endophytica]
MRVERTEAGVLVGAWPAHAERTALLEARGALLAWDVLADDPVPSARIHDLDRAADWLWEVYGTAAAAITSGAAEVTVPAEGDWRVRDACRVVAHLGWADAWWPASPTAGVPALDPALLRAELAVATGSVEHLLDAEDAVERALAAVGPFTADPAVDALAARLVALAEDYGVVLAEAAVPSRSSFALAAGGGEQAEGVTVLSGADAVDWALVPQGVVDAAADARWSLVRRQGSTFLEVAVSPGPRSGPPLAARFGQVEVALDDTDGLGRVTGRAPVPPTVLLLPPAQRVLTVYAPDFASPAAGPDPDARTRRAAIVARARSRVGSPTATLTERLAGRR